MSIEEQRARFEAYAKSKGHTNLRCWGERQGCEGCNDYDDDFVSVMWEAWKAALDSVCVTLPEKQQPTKDDDIQWHAVRNRTIEACQRAIHAAGVKTK